MESEVMPGTKRCFTCKEPKKTGEYGRNRRSKDKLEYSCRDCIKERVRQSRLRRADQINKRCRERYGLNREASRAKLKKYRSENKSKFQKWDSEAYQKRRRRKYETNKAWREKNPELYLEYIERRQFRLKNAPGGPYNPIRYVGRAEVYDFMCAYCLVKPYETFDHAIPVSRAGSNWPSNIYPVCRSCNSSKKNRILHKEWSRPIDRGNK